MLTLSEAKGKRVPTKSDAPPDDFDLQIRPRNNESVTPPVTEDFDLQIHPRKVIPPSNKQANADFDLHPKKRESGDFDLNVRSRPTQEASNNFDLKPKKRDPLDFKIEIKERTPGASDSQER